MKQQTTDDHPVRSLHTSAPGATPEQCDSVWTERELAATQAASELTPWEPWQGKRFPHPWDATLAAEAD